MGERYASMDNYVLSQAGDGKPNPVAKVSPLLVSINKVLLIHNYIHLFYVICGYFRSTMADLSTHSTDSMAHKA